jgi:CPA1 family monovalent cation:H+ antiporter
MTEPDAGDVSTAIGTEVVIELLVAAIVVALVTKRIRIPYTVALVLVGFAIGFSHLFHPVVISKEILLLVFLPPLLFEGTVAMRLSHLRERWLEVLLLAVPATLACFAVTAAAVHLALGCSWMVAFLVGAILSPTDPVSVLALFREMGVSKDISTIVEGESVFNDGIGVVLFLVIARALRGGASTLGAAGELFAIEVAGGLAIGIVLGYAAYKLLSKIDDHLIEVAISIAVAFGSYLLAERLSVSGVMAVVAAGLVIGNYATALAMSPTTRLAIGTFWEVAAFIANSLVFLLMGIAVQSVDLAPMAWKIGLVFVALVASRQLSVYIVGAISQAVGRKFPWSWRHLVGWSGLRGSVPIALVLGIAPGAWAPPGPHPARQELLTLVFGVVLLSLLLQGLSIKPLLRVLGLAERSEAEARYEHELGRRIALAAARSRLGELHGGGDIGRELYDELHELLERRGEEAHRAMRELFAAHPEIAEARRRMAVRALLLAERAALEDAFRRGSISEEAQAALRREIDEKLAGGEGEEAAV